MRIEAEDGIVLPTAMTVMLVLSLLTAAALGVSVNVSDTSKHDRRAKQALSAAEAGLQVAFYRMNQASSAALPANRCLTTVAVVPGTAPAAAGECPGHTEQLGNGTSYTYYVTPTLGATGTCASVPGVTPLTTDRCITAVGTAGGVSRRVQMRSSMKLSFTDFSRAGLVGKTKVYFDNSEQVESDVGSNGNVELRNSIEVKSGSASTGRVLLATGGTSTYGGSVTVQGGTPDQPGALRSPPDRLREPGADGQQQQRRASVIGLQPDHARVRPGLGRLHAAPRHVPLLQHESRQQREAQAVEQPADAHLHRLT